MSVNTFLLIDISNTFTKLARAGRQRIGRIHRVPTPQLGPSDIRRLLRPEMAVVVCSVVPEVTRRISSAFPEAVVSVGPRHAGGLAIDYPQPSKIGADRLANALACQRLYGTPAIVVDFGTAVTFDVISQARGGAYIGGVIAPGLNMMAEYLHSRTALLPRIRLAKPVRVVGRSTRQAMLSGAVHGYRGLVREILDQIRRESFPRGRPVVVATGGDASLLENSLKIFDHVDPLLTLRGLQIIANHEWPREAEQRPS